jgi:hypothetical protein
MRTTSSAAQQAGRVPNRRNSGGRLALGQRHEGVDPGHERLADGLRVRGIGHPLGGHVAAIEKQARSIILGEVARPEVGGEQPEAALAPQVDLPEAVAGRVEPLDEEKIIAGRGAEMGDAPAVDGNLGRRAQSCDGDGFGGCGVFS